MNIMLTALFFQSLGIVPKITSHNGELTPNLCPGVLKWCCMW